MKMYKRLLLTYFAKYKMIDTSLLSRELHLSETQITDAVYELCKIGYLQIKKDQFILTDLGKRWAFDYWNVWSRYENRMKETSSFEWDYLYIPENMV